VAKAPTLSPIEAADREDAVADWLDGHGIDGGWSLAPVFVQAGLDAGWLDQIAACVDEDTLDGAVRWLNYTVETELPDERDRGLDHQDLVAGGRGQAVFPDRPAPFQVVDVHDLLDSTLVMLAGKIGAGITVVKDYDLGPADHLRLSAELNQVWTNLIDNAVDAMGGTGTLTMPHRARPRPGPGRVR
jgi:hypothetical protein